MTIVNRIGAFLLLAAGNGFFDRLFELLDRLEMVDLDDVVDLDKLAGLETLACLALRI